MKKEYITPTAEKIRFNYRDQVVAASGEGGGGTSNPSFGSITRENWGSNGCKLYALEATGWNLCSYA